MPTPIANKTIATPLLCILAFVVAVVCPNGVLRRLWRDGRDFVPFNSHKLRAFWYGIHDTKSHVLLCRKVENSYARKSHLVILPLVILPL